MAEKKSNYDIMREDAEKRFLGYDQQKMIEKFHLSHDEQYLYLRFVGHDYRINRSTGKAEWSEDHFQTATAAGFDDSLAIFDVLCYSRDDCHLGGHFAQIDRVKRTNFASAPGPGLYHSYAVYFDQNMELLSKVLERLGGSKEKPGDVAYRLQTFDFLPIILQFWASDDEFPPTLKFMWDENTLDFIHFETAFYIMGHVLGRLKEEMEGLLHG